MRGAHHRHPAGRRLDDRDRGAAFAVAVGRLPAGGEKDVVARHRVQQPLVRDHAREGDDLVEPATAHDVLDAPALGLLAGAAVRGADQGHAKVGAALPGRRHRLQRGGDALLRAKGSRDEHARRISGLQGSRPAGDAVQVHTETLDLQLRLRAAEARDRRRHERTLAEDQVGGREQLRVAAAPDRPGPRIHRHVVPVEGHDVCQPVAPGQRQVRPAAIPEVRVQDLRPVTLERTRVGVRVEAHASTLRRPHHRAVHAPHRVERGEGKLVEVGCRLRQDDRLVHAGSADLGRRPRHGGRQPHVEGMGHTEVDHFSSTSRTAAITSSTSRSSRAGDSGRLTVCRPMRRATG